MNFWQAIRNLLQGQKVVRTSWQGQYLNVLSSPANTLPDVFICDDNVHSQERFTPTDEDVAATDWAAL